MTTFTVNINNKKTEKAIKAVLDAFGVDYSIAKQPDVRDLSGTEQELYNRLKDSVEQIKQHKKGSRTLRSIDDVLAELS